MGRRTGTKQRKRYTTSTLRSELESRITTGRCVYCRTAARPERPLTREHVIPRARGGRRNDLRIIVPACARCNHHRGCRDLIPFLLARPRRLSAFIDYLGELSPASIRELDLRVFAEVYTAVAILRECAAHGVRWRWERERLCTGRSLHRRRYAARRAVGAVSARLESLRHFREPADGPTCFVPVGTPCPVSLSLDEPVERLASRLLGVLALLWEVSAGVIEREMGRELTGTAVGFDAVGPRAANDTDADTLDSVVPLDGWKARRKRKRTRTDRRGMRPPRATAPHRGRAA